jgi:hypothetical protein
MVITYTEVFHGKTLQNLTNIRIFGLKINHLATLPWMAADGSLAGGCEFESRQPFC